MTRTTTKLLATTVLAMSIAQVAHAGGPLAVCESGEAFKWTNGGQDIPFNPDQGNLGPVPAADAVALVDDAFQVWEDVATSDATYTNAGSLPVDVDITNFGPFLEPVGPDGLSAIVFDDTGEIFDLLFGPGSGILGFAGPEFGDTATCEITEGLSFLNGPAFGDLTAAFDVMVHEFGHYSNLAHTDVNAQQFIGVGDTSGPQGDDFGVPDPFGETIATMYPFYFGPDVGTRTLHKDDMTSLSTLYPEPEFATDFATISGTIFAPNGETRLTGVNVVARNVDDPFLDAVTAISSDFTDSLSQADPVVGTYAIEGLTPGAEYAVYVDEILAGGFSTTLLNPLPGPEEYFNGAREGALNDDPSDLETVSAGAGQTAQGVDIVFNAPAPGDPLNVGDDGNVQVFLPFDYKFCGVEWESVFVNANGNLTFGTPSADFSESAGELLAGPPRIAGLWDDLNPSAGGTVSFSESRNALTVTYDSVPEFFSDGSNTFSITLRKGSGHVELDYGDLTAEDGVAGVSCGGAITSGFEDAVDLSAQRGRINLRRDPAVYEVFTIASPVDLDGDRIRFNGATDYNDNWAENNDSFDRARSIALPFSSVPLTRYTEIEPTGDDVDFFAFDAEAGTTLIAEVATGNIDSLLGLFDNAGRLVAVDDDGGAGVLSRIVYSVPSDGRYVLAVTTFPDTEFVGAGGSGGRYVLDVEAIDGTVLSLGDDDSVEVALSFGFPYQGQVWNSVFVNSNGSLTFGSGDTDFSESVGDLLSGQPRVAGLWDDLSPNQGGVIIVDGDEDGVSVKFDGVPEFFSSSGNSFDMTLASDGSVGLSYGAVAAFDGLAGVTEGGGASDPGPTDLSEASSLSANGTTYEQFTFGAPVDLSDTDLDFEP